MDWMSDLFGDCGLFADVSRVFYVYDDSATAKLSFRRQRDFF